MEDDSQDPTLGLSTGQALLLFGLVVPLFAASTGWLTVMLLAPEELPGTAVEQEPIERVTDGVLLDEEDAGPLVLLDAERTSWQRELERDAAEVREACGYPLTLRCDEVACVVRVEDDDFSRALNALRPQPLVERVLQAAGLPEGPCLSSTQALLRHARLESWRSPDDDVCLGFAPVPPRAAPPGGAQMHDGRCVNCAPVEDLAPAHITALCRG